jgi:hypothetical protein
MSQQDSNIKWIVFLTVVVFLWLLAALAGNR